MACPATAASVMFGARIRRPSSPCQPAWRCSRYASSVPSSTIAAARSSARAIVSMPHRDCPFDLAGTDDRAATGGSDGRVRLRAACARPEVLSRRARTQTSRHGQQARRRSKARRDRHWHWRTWDSPLWRPACARSDDRRPGSVKRQMGPGGSPATANPLSAHYPCKIPGNPALCRLALREPAGRRA